MKKAICYILSLFALGAGVFGPLVAVKADVVCTSTTPTCGGGGGASVSGANAWTGTNSFIDSLFTILDDADPTKKIAFQASGVTTGTTRTIGVDVNGLDVGPSGATTSANTGIVNSTNSIGIRLGSDQIIKLIPNISNGGSIGTALRALNGATNQLGFLSTSAAIGIAATGGAPVVQLGMDVNGAAVPQILKAHDGITGTDIAGASLTVGPGKGTGAAVSGSMILNRNLVGATGTTAQTQAPSYVACPTKILSNTSATAQTIATITTTSTTGGSVKMFYTVVANNGTLQDTDAGEIVIGWNNNAGTVAVAASAVYGQMDSDASGTLAATPTVTAATNVVSIKQTPTWVTIVPTTVTSFATFEVNGVNTVACQ